MTTTFEDDDALAHRSRDGDARALATLYRRHGPGLLEYLNRLLGDRSDAEDVLQETFLRVFEARGRYAGRGRFRSWLFTIATHLARDRHRRRRRRERLTVEEMDRFGPSGSVDPGSEIEAAELAAVVESVLADLPPAYSVTFHLRVREEFTYAEIAAMHGESPGTLRSRVHHTLRRIRRALTRSEATDRGTIRNEEDPR